MRDQGLGRGRLASTALIALLTLTVITGCVGGSTEPEALPPSPADLIGAWTVEADGTDAGTVMTVSRDEFALWRQCGDANGPWIASADGRLAMTTQVWTGRCRDQRTDSPWVYRVRGFRSAGDERELVAADGRVLARLVPGGVPTPRANRSSRDAQTPIVDDALRGSFAREVRLPPGLEPATTATVRGRWVREIGSVLPDGSQASVRFGANDRWRGSDGCNAQGGLWLLGPDSGTVTSTGGFTTQRYCDAAATSPTDAIPDTRALGFDGAVLVLIDGSGEELARLRRAPSPEPATSGR